MPPAQRLSAEDAQYCLQKLREQAPDLYLASLLVPQSIRDEVAVLHTFHAEITGITLATPEPMAGEIRLQWWMDVLHRLRDAEAAQNTLSRALLAVIEKHDLPASALISKLETHTFDLYADPMGDTPTLEAYLGETRSVIFQLAAMIANPDGAQAANDASGHTGVATGCVAIVENLARHRAQHRVHFPSDILESSGTTAERLLAETGKPETNAVLALVDMADLHYAHAKEALACVPEPIKPVFAPLSLVPLYLKRIGKHPKHALTGMPPISQLRRQWALWRG